MDDLNKRIAELSPAKRALLELRLKTGKASEALTQTITPRANRSSAVVSFAQQRLWFLDQLEENHALYNVPRALRLNGVLDIAALQRALNELVARHEPFRTCFESVDGTLRQIIKDDAELRLVQTDLSQLSFGEREARANELIREEAGKAFDLTHGPVMRAHLLRLSDQEHILLLTTHHIVSDAWSAGILFHELGQLYNAFANGEPSPLPPLAIHYADFAEWQRTWVQGNVLKRQLSYWRSKLDGVTGILELPTDRPRSAGQESYGAYRFLTLSKNVSDGVAELSKREGATVFMTLLAAFQILLWRYSNQDDIIVGSPIAGRNREEIEDLIGFFVNSLVLRTDLSGNPTFRELLQRVKETAVAAYAHQDLPFEKLVEELQPERNLHRNPLFQVMFQYQNALPAPMQMNGLSVSKVDTYTETAKFDLMLVAYEQDRALKCVIEYNSGLFNGATIERMLDQYATLLESIVAKPDHRIANLSLMSEAEQRQVLVDWNRTQADFPHDQCIHQLFEQQTARTPDDVAVVFGDERVTYRELNARANQLAHHLRRRGVGPEVRVAICVERSVDMIAGLFGILKAGGVYVPLEPRFPADRISFILADCNARLLLTQQHLKDSLPTSAIDTIYLDAQAPEMSAENPQVITSAENSAHVIYTSGSTGVPKGVVSAHRASVNRFAWSWKTYPFADGEVCCQKTSLSFVDSIWEIFGPLLQGVPLVIIPDDVVKDPQRFLGALSANHVSRLVLVPSLLRVMLEAGEDLTGMLQDLRYCVCSGETLPVELATSFRQQLPNTTLINLYGSSEVAADVTCCEVRDTDELTNIPIGRPIANTDGYILDADFQPVPVGASGEICIGGEGLARGYLHRPDLTAEKFVPHPFSKQPGARLFRTGDIGRYLPDGNVEYRGRRDHQVKLRGFRIELGEIEAQLASHPQVDQAIVVAVDTKRGDKHLVAYVSVVGEAPSNNDLRAHLRRKLPDHMIPSAFVTLEKFPLTASGKINRLALPKPNQAQLASREEFVAPRTATEEILASIWSSILDVEDVGVFDDFFALGGHSLLLVRVAARIRESFQLELPLRSLFEAPTLAALAELVEAARRSTQGLDDLPMTAIARDGELPLSFAQERLWVFEHLEPNTGAYNIPRVLRLNGPLDADALIKSVNAIVARHEVLRTSFLNVDGKPSLSIAESATLEIPIIDLTKLAADDQNVYEAGASHPSRLVPQLNSLRERTSEAGGPASLVPQLNSLRERTSEEGWLAPAARELAAAETQRPFDFSTAPLFRLSLLRLGDREHVLLLTMHHIVCDAWSIGVFMRELVACYNAFTAEMSPSLPALPVQYVDFAAWQRKAFSGAPLQKQIEYWRKKLRGAPPVINLPTDQPRPSVRSFHGARRSFTVTKEIADQLKTLARAERATLFMTLLTAFQSLLACLTNENDIVVGSPVAGRNRPECEPLIGYFVNTLVLRSEFPGNPSFRESLQQTRETALGAFANQDVPFERLVEDLNPERSAGYNPLFQVWFVLQQAFVERQEFNGLTVKSVDSDNAVTRHDLQLSLWETGNGLEGAFTYSTALFEAETIACIIEQFRSLLVAVVAEPDMRLSRLRELVSEAGRAYRDKAIAGLEETSRQKFKSVRRKVVVGAVPTAVEESWTNPNQ